MNISLEKIKECQELLLRKSREARHKRGFLMIVSVTSRDDVTSDIRPIERERS